MKREGEIDGLEKRTLTLGFVPLADCAPLVVARERGFFESFGLSVDLSREASWATVRDKVAVEALDGAQMLAAMPLAATLGLDGLRAPMLTGLSLDLNGNGIVLSRALWAEMAPARETPAAIGEALARTVASRAARGLPKLRLAVTFPHSSHNYLLRHWLAASGIDPDADLRLTIVPPPRMLAHLIEGDIDGYCVGAPWGQIAVDLGVGRLALTTYDVWNNHPEKVLGVTRAWAERHPNAHLALVMAVLSACRWLDAPDNRLDAARLLAQTRYVDTPVEALEATLCGRLLTGAGIRALPDFHVFHRYAANFPWRSHALWALAQMRRWRQIGANIDDRALADAVYRPDIYRAAARRIGLDAPDADFKSEGTQAGIHAFAGAEGAIELGPDLFCDGAIFEPPARSANRLTEESDA
ncbi:MAG: ABC transporter substrate-binding protein [Tagaea sp.]|nr:ABC transporter substrate-binding protein [Tagaea sp.]